MAEVRKNHPSHEVKPQREAKQQRGLQTRSTTEVKWRDDHRSAAPTWAPRMELDGAPLLSEASIRDFQQGIVGYVADVVE